MDSRRRRVLLLNLVWIAANIAIYALGLLSGQHPLSVNDAYSEGIQILSDGHSDPGPVVEVIVLASMLASIRSLALAYRAYFSPSPIEVHAIENATGRDMNMKALDMAFREYLASPRIYQVTTVPGDPDRIVLSRSFRHPLMAAGAVSPPQHTRTLFPGGHL